MKPQKSWKGPVREVLRHMFFICYAAALFAAVNGARSLAKSQKEEEANRLRRLSAFEMKPPVSPKGDHASA